MDVVILVIIILLHINSNSMGKVLYFSERLREKEREKMAKRDLKRVTG